MASASVRLAALLCTVAACSPFDGDEAPPDLEREDPTPIIEPAPEPPGEPSIALVQEASSCVDTTRTAVVDLAKPITRGDLVVIAIGWFDASASITDVHDQAGNPYRPVSAQTTVRTSETELRQQIWYAPGVSPGVGKLEVRWDRPATNPDLRVAEFAGLDPVMPVSAAKVARSSNALELAGDVEVTHGPSLVFAGITTEGLAQRGGPGVQALISSEGNLAAWRVVDAPGTYSVTAVQTKEAGDGPSLEAITEVVAFR